MKHPDHYYLGKFVRTHGVKGDLLLLLDTDSPDRYRKMKSLLIDEGGSLKLYEVATVIVQSDGETARVHLKGIEDMNAAELLLKKEVYQPLSSLPALRGKSFYFHEIPGFKVIDATAGELGILTNVFELPQHPVGEVIVQGKEVLFPLSDDCIQRIDRKERIIYIQLPEGLLDVYLS